MIPSLPALRAEEIYKFFPLDLEEHEAISSPVPSGSGLLLVLEYHVTPSSSNLFYIVDIHGVNFTRRLLL